MEFLYKAYADSGEVKEGRVAAAGKREAANELRSRGLHPMTIRKTGEKKKVSLFKRRRLADLAEEWAPAAAKDVQSFGYGNPRGKK